MDPKSKFRLDCKLICVQINWPSKICTCCLYESTFVFILAGSLDQQQTKNWLGVFCRLTKYGVGKNLPSTSKTDGLVCVNQFTFKAAKEEGNFFASPKMPSVLIRCVDSLYKFSLYKKCIPVNNLILDFVRNDFWFSTHLGVAFLAILYQTLALWLRQDRPLSVFCCFFSLFGRSNIDANKGVDRWQTRSDV